MNIEDLVGMSVFDATDLLQKLREEHSIKAIVAVLIDGESILMTSDYRPDRLQVETENNKIVRIRGRG
jgi:hypothetical protein